jgi:hypothetical protein
VLKLGPQNSVFQQSRENSRKNACRVCLRYFQYAAAENSKANFIGTKFPMKLARFPGSFPGPADTGVKSSLVPGVPQKELRMKDENRQSVAINAQESTKQNAKKIKKARNAGRVLSAVLTGTTVLTPLVATGCPTEVQTPVAPKEETVCDITIKTYEGKNIVVKGLIPSDPAIAKITEATSSILSFEEPDAMHDTFKDYVKQRGLIIIVEDVSVYSTDKNYRIDDENGVAMRYEFVSTGTVFNIELNLAKAVNDMDILYITVAYANQFDTAKETVRTAFGKRCPAPNLG